MLDPGTDEQHEHHVTQSEGMESFTPADCVVNSRARG